MVDWSAANSRTTGKDSIWVAEWMRDSKYIILTNYPTREEAYNYLTGIMDKASKNKNRLLIGFDFAFGYPADAYDKFKCKDKNVKCKNWEYLWTLISTRITDNHRNKNNRFEIANKLNLYFTGVGPFWRHPNPNDNRFGNLPYYQPDGYDDWLPSEFRLVEDLVGNQPRINPSSVWELYNPGSVGSQVLMGIPTLQKLKERKKGEDCIFWPFQDLDKNKHVIAEIYPSIWDEEYRNIGLVKDAGQVKTVVQQLSCHDEKGDLKNLLNEPYKHDKKDIITEKEGWILGLDETGKPAEMITSNRPHLLYD